MSAAGGATVNQLRRLKQKQHHCPTVVALAVIITIVAREKEAEIPFCCCSNDGGGTAEVDASLKGNTMNAIYFFSNIDFFSNTLRRNIRW